MLISPRCVFTVVLLTLIATGAAQADITSPGDIVRGVPDDGDWPGAESPPLAIDDDVNTKYLHFKGETQTTGFQVTPSAGPSVITGLTFTTANDALERDPVAFALYGSNTSIDGPYTLIAEGDIRGDLFELCGGAVAGRTDTAAVTLFKNGGGAHLDLMTARFLWARVGG